MSLARVRVRYRIRDLPVKQLNYGGVKHNGANESSGTGMTPAQAATRDSIIRLLLVTIMSKMMIMRLEAMPD